MVGGNSNLIDVEILQMVRVLENGEEVKMSKRSGKAITLSDLLDEVGSDALRYFYVAKSLSTHMDLDLDLMKQNLMKTLFSMLNMLMLVSLVF